MRLACIVGAGCLLVACTQLAQAQKVSVILDTDVFSDVDDVGAVAILHVLADAGEAQILGMVVNTPSRWGAACVSAINTYYGRPDIPIGTLKPNDDSVSTTNYAQVIAQEFPHALHDGTDAPDAVQLYRQLLATRPAKSVVIVSIGLLTNLQRLLVSLPDPISPLGGRDLIAQKVKQLVVLGGQYPSGREFNFQSNPKATIDVVGSWPTPVVFDGVEVGATVMTGSTLSSTMPASSPVRRAYEIYVGAGNARSSWDLTAVLFAVRAAGTLFSEAGAGGGNVIAADGSNAWQAPAASTQVYLVKTAGDQTIADALEQLLDEPPRPQRPDAGTGMDMTTSIDMARPDASQTASSPACSLAITSPSSFGVGTLLLFIAIARLIRRSLARRGHG